MLRRFLILTVGLISSVLTAVAADPTETSYPWSDCQGSAKPYPAPAHVVAYPDSLTPVMINHVGRHGARFPASAKNNTTLRSALQRAESSGTITPLGRKLLKLTETVAAEVNGRWGALNSVGEAEQRGIASRMIAAYPDLFRNSIVRSISSYAPRCIMSMDEFTHQLARMDNSVELDMASGRRFSPLMRFFDDNEDYSEFRESESLKATYDGFRRSQCPTAQLLRVFGQKFDFDSYPVSAVDLAMAQYAVLSGLQAMGISADVAEYLTPAEQNRLWSVMNIRHYLQYSASTLSSVPASMASPLLADLIDTTEAFISGNAAVAKVNLRFGHAETLMPLLSLIHLPGCYYLTNYFDTVALHWRDFDVVPMAANIQMILFQSSTGKYYLRFDHNEQPVTLIPGDQRIYLPWSDAKTYLQRCLPLF